MRIWRHPVTEAHPGGCTDMSEHTNHTRRGLLGLGALAAVGWREFAFAASPAAGDTNTAALRELDYGQVQFGEGPLERQARENHQLVLNLDEDSLLRPFRLRSKQKAPGNEL